MPAVKIYNMEGSVVGERELDPTVFAITGNPALLHQTVVAARANARLSLAHTKTRGEVRGGGKKPWKQKGTGRARHGSIRSPIWRGGGVTFGPRKERNWEQRLSKTMRRKALLMCLSDKVSSGRLVLLDRLELAAPKTKQIAALLAKLPVFGKTLLAVPSLRETAVVRASRNLPAVEVIGAANLNALAILGHETLMLPLPALEIVEATFKPKK